MSIRSRAKTASCSTFQGRKTPPWHFFPKKSTVAFLFTAALASPACALDPTQLQRIDAAASAALAATGVPGASVAIVQGGRIVAERAYGFASLDPKRSLTPSMIMPIGSVSKQFTASVILLLVQDGRLSLDDKVAKYLPELTQANDITVRMLLEHVSGYQDDQPEDYSVPQSAVPRTPQSLADEWGRKPLDFPPGTQWQYSNTGFTIAALIAQKAGGRPFFAQLRDGILAPLHLDSAIDFDALGLPKGAPVGYEQYALEAPHPGTPSAPGWSFGAGELAMTAHDLAAWDISILNRSLLKPASYDAMETEAHLRNGHGTGYGLGVFVGSHGSHRFIEHSGEEVGFVSENLLYPDEHDAVVVLTNQDASRAASIIGRAVSRIAFGIDAAAGADPQARQVLAICAGLAEGKLDRSLFNDAANAYFTPAAIAAYRASLQSLGMPLAIHERVKELRGGMTFRAYSLDFARRTVTVTVYEEPDGKLDQFLIVA
jgi:CubicO group peptidase (beta-lactamase class C family)